MSNEGGSGRPFRPSGRRVLFVDPPSVIQEHMIHFLVTAQYEAGVVRDHRAVHAVLRKYPNSIVYFNLDTRMPPGALEQIIRAVIAGSSHHGADVGILSYNENKELARHYLMDVGVTLGYITLGLGFEKSARIIIKALEASEARGDRRYVRVKAPTNKALLNLKSDSGTVNGRILDISEAGMACTLSAEYSKGTYLENIQLQLWGNLATVNGTIEGTRETPTGRIYVVMFDPISESKTRGKIYSFLKRVMQHEIDAVM